MLAFLTNTQLLYHYGFLEITIMIVISRTSRKVAEKLIEKGSNPSTFKLLKEMNWLNPPKIKISEDSSIIAQQFDSNVVPDETDFSTLIKR